MTLRPFDSLRSLRAGSRLAQGRPIRLPRASGASRGVGQDRRNRARAAALILLGTLAACGKKGPPLPPLHLVPEPVTEISARRSGDEVRLRFTLPLKNANAPGPVNIGRVEIYGATIAPGADAPPNRELLTSKFVVGRIDVEPPREEGAPAADDPRPAPGDVATFVEELTEDKQRPQFTATAPAGATAPPAAAAPAASTATRVYAIRGIAPNGRPGPASTRIEVPLVPAPAPPEKVEAEFTEKAIELTWTPPSGAPGQGTTAAPAFNVYEKGGDVPLNASPLAEPRFERGGIAFGKEACFVVRSLLRFGPVTIESEPSDEACVTPADVFPPAAPKALSAVAAGGAINLIWDSVPDADLAGYIVLRGEAPGETLQPITPTPIRETTYRDTSVTPGVRYVYAIVAVDNATPPNTSAQSPRVEEVAR